MIVAPLLAPGVKLTVSGPVVVVVAPGTAFTFVGAAGTVAGTKLFDAADGALVPTVLAAVTLQVYVLPLVRPVTVIGLEDPGAEPAAPPSLDVHVAV